MRRSFTAIDLFSGGGGLSTGLRRAGFIVRVGVESDPVAARVFKANHRGTRLFEKDVRGVESSALKEAAGGPVALVAGCAPCQGFCSLTSKWSREDPRNELLLEMARVVEGLAPPLVVMENVPGVLDKGARILEAFNRRLRDAGYYVRQGILQMADYGIPQRRRRFVLLAGRGFVIPLPTPTHARVPSDGSQTNPWMTLRDAIGDLPPPVTMSKALKLGGPRSFNWHVVRDLKERTRERLRAAVPGESWTGIPEHLRPKCHRNGYSGFTNVYGRMRWDAPAPAITSGCTTPAKGRFGHPDRRRLNTISVREAAALQTFPEDYDFATEQMDAVCEVIGNAVPPRFGEILGRTVRAAYEAHLAALARAPGARSLPAGSRTQEHRVTVRGTALRPGG